MHTNIHTNIVHSLNDPNNICRKKDMIVTNFFTTHSRPLIYMCMYINQKEIIIIKIKRFNCVLVCSITGI